MPLSKPIQMLPVISWKAERTVLLDKPEFLFIWKRSLPLASNIMTPLEIVPKIKLPFRNRILLYTLTDDKSRLEGMFHFFKPISSYS